jgi:hypothetical protein
LKGKRIRERKSKKKILRLRENLIKEKTLEEKNSRKEIL